MSAVDVPGRVGQQPQRTWLGPLTSLWSGPFAPSAFEWVFVITGGLIIGLPFVLWMGEAALGRSDVVRWYFWINALISSPHVYGTYVRQYRKTREGKVHWMLGFPTYGYIVIGLTVLQQLGFFIEALTLINVWQSYHYVRQTYGVGCIYGRQVQFNDHDRAQRWWAYHLIFPALIIGRWDLLYDVWQGKTYSFIPVDFSGYLMTLLWIVAGIGVAVDVWSEITLLRRNGKDYSPVGFICFVVFFAAHFFGFVVASYYQRGFFAITIFHAVQYLGLVWIMERRAGSNQGQGWATLPNLVGFTLFWFFLFALGYSFENKVTVALSTVWGQASTILLASISAHHYFVDSFLWRRSAGA